MTELATLGDKVEQAYAFIAQWVYSNEYRGLLLKNLSSATIILVTRYVTFVVYSRVGHGLMLADSSSDFFVGILTSEYSGQRCY